jgi:transcriptional regulator with XRE-family HTH domain
MIIRLAQIRLEKDLTLHQLSELSGVSKTQINDIENGKTFPTIKVLCALAKALQVPVTDLFSCDDKL